MVPTYRRPEGLRRLLAALAEERIDLEWELVVVNNDPADPRIAEIVGGQPFPPEVRVRCVTESRPGASAARNRGIREATGAVIGMLDDDVVPRPGWLRAIVRPLREDPAVIAVTGKVILDPAVSRPRWFDEAGLGGYLTAFDLGPRPRDLANHEILVTANAAVRRAALLATGGFDERFGPRRGVQLVADDARLTRSLARLPPGEGGRLVWTPEAVVVHELPERRLRLLWLVRRAWWQGRSDWMLERLDHPGRRFGAARVALVSGGRWWWHEWQRRRGAWRSSRPGRRAVAVHAVTDLARVAGLWWQAVQTATVGRFTS